MEELKGDARTENYFDPNQLVNRLREYFEDKDIPAIPQQIVELQKKVTEKGFQTVPIYDYQKKIWVLMESRKRPDYTDGRQMFEDDQAMGSILEGLRKDKKFAVPGREFGSNTQVLERLPQQSRFGGSRDEITEFVLPKVAESLELDTTQVGLPTQSQFQTVAEVLIPELGRGGGEEWFDDLDENGLGTVGGRYTNGEPEDSIHIDTNLHSNNRTFRAVFYPEPSTIKTS